MSGKTSVSVGMLGEMKALRCLMKKGMKPVKWRYRGAGGEIDLILRDGDVWVFAEVKSRPDGGIHEGASAVNRDKKTRIRRCAEHYIKTHRVNADKVRFDVVEISRAGIRHIFNAF